MKKRSYECDKKVKGLYSFGKSNKHLIKLLTFFPLFIPLSVVHTVWDMNGYHTNSELARGSFNRILSWRYIWRRQRGTKSSKKNLIILYLSEILFFWSSLKAVIKPFITNLLRETVCAYEKTLWVISSISICIQTPLCLFGRLNYVSNLKKN